jgi:hypothetical protein
LWKRFVAWRKAVGARRWAQGGGHEAGEIDAAERGELCYVPVDEIVRGLWREGRVTKEIPQVT